MTSVRAAIAAVALTCGLSTFAQAQVTVDVAKITCEQFILAKIASPEDLALWLSGFYHGKRNSTVFEPLQQKAIVDKIRQFCRMNLSMSVMRAAESVIEEPK